jgi:hypothetical protein
VAPGSTKPESRLMTIKIKQNISARPNDGFKNMTDGNFRFRLTHENEKELGAKIRI